MNLSEQVRLKNDIVEVISEYGIQLKPAGRGYKALCPFHDDKTPSLSISPDSQLFYCFGCGVGGTVIHFVMRYEGISYGEALRKLAQRAGISLPGLPQIEAVPDRDRLWDALQFALKFYHNQIFKPENRAALRYLRERGVKDESIRVFKLGYAPQGWRNLLEAASKAGLKADDLVKAGIAAESRDGTNLYDYFRNRIIFPIFDHQGRVVGFSGRSLDGSEPKYINTPETSLFHKGKLLYNLHLAKDHIRRSRRAVLVEGYMDVVIPYQFGVRNIVASSGTSLTEDQAALLKRYADEVVIVYDGDEAGLNAAARGLTLLLKEGLRVRVAVLPEGMDPDTFVRSNGGEQFERYVENADDLIEFRLKLASKRGDIHKMEVKMEVAKELVDMISHIKSQIELSEYVKRIALELDLAEGAIRAELKRRGVRLSVRRIIPHKAYKTVRISPRMKIERQLLRYLLYRPDLIEAVRPKFSPRDLSNKTYSRIISMLWKEFDSVGRVDVREIIDSCDDERLRGVISGLLIEAHERIGGEFDVAAAIEGCLKKIRGFNIREMEERVKSEANDQDELALLRELMKLSSLRKE